MLHFDVAIYTYPPNTGRKASHFICGASVTPLALSGIDLCHRFAVTFEAVAERLERLPRMYFEPDGSFVWVGSDAERAASSWQVDGHLYDRDGALLYMTLKGICPAEAFDSLLRTCGWPEQALAFQLAREAIVLDESDFRQVAKTSSS